VQDSDVTFAELDDVAAWWLLRVGSNGRAVQADS